MKVFRSVDAMRGWRRSVASRKSVGFVPTMGALHEGHLSLLKRAARENDVVVASVFVNPTQFGPKEDFKRYPRPWSKDRSLLQSVDVQTVFLPTVESMYVPGHSTSVVVSGLTSTLCGSPSSRGPQHFVGVATVVAKLFNILQPTRAYFGMKDFQQLRVIEQMTIDLNLPVRIVRCPTWRESDGLIRDVQPQRLSFPARARPGAAPVSRFTGREKTLKIPSVHEPAGGLPKRRFHPRSTSSIPH